MLVPQSLTTCYPAIYSRLHYGCAPKPTSVRNADRPRENASSSPDPISFSAPSHAYPTTDHTQDKHPRFIKPIAGSLRTPLFSSHSVHATNVIRGFLLQSMV
jgi:hypothetical protein